VDLFSTHFDLTFYDFSLLLSQGLSEEEVERFIADLLLAAIDTTSVTALWLIYVLATQPTVQVRTHLC
jgi:cytochrome P450